MNGEIWSSFVGRAPWSNLAMIPVILENKMGKKTFPYPKIVIHAGHNPTGSCMISVSRRLQTEELSKQKYLEKIA